MMRSLIALISLVLLSACAGPMSSGDMAATRHIGVVSRLGNTVHLSSVGTTAFTNRYASAVVDDWQIDVTTGISMVDYLKRTRSLNASRLDLPDTSSRRVATENEDIFWTAAAAKGFDRLVVIDGVDNAILPRMRAGYGLYERFFFGSGKRCVYVSLQVSIYDVATRKTLAWDIGDVDPCLRGADYPVAVKDSFAEYSESERQALRAQIQQTAFQTAKFTLERLLPR